MEEESKKEIEELKNRLNSFEEKFNHFMIHTHDGNDSVRIDMKNIKGDYTFFKDQRPTI